MDSFTLIEKITKLKILYDTDFISFTEYSIEVNKIIEAFKVEDLNEDTLTFMERLSVLKANDTLSLEMIESFKKKILHNSSQAEQKVAIQKIANPKSDNYVPKESIIQNITPTQPEPYDRDKKSYGLLIVIPGLVLIILIIIFFASKNSSNKVEIINNVENTNESKIAKQEESVFTAFNTWISKTNNKDITISDLYADKLDKYYIKKNVKKSDVIKDKNNFFNKWKVIKIDYSNLVSKSTPDNISKLEYDKIFETVNGKKKYSGAVKSSLTFKKSGEKYLIIHESDDKVYYINK